MDKITNRRRIAAAYWKHDERVFLGLMQAVVRSECAPTRNLRLDQAFSRRVRVAAS